MANKGKLPEEEKIRLVEIYLNGMMTLKKISTEYQINMRTITDWVRLYKVRGSEGLRSTSARRCYSDELKRQVVEEYLHEAASLRSLCTKYDISDKRSVQEWIKEYNGYVDYDKRRVIGGINYMTKGRKTTLDERIEIVSSCIANKKAYGTTIKEYGVSYGQILYWIKKYENGGIEALVDRRGQRKDNNSLTETERLKAQLKLKDAENIRLQMELDLLKKLDEVERRRGQA